MTNHWESQKHVKLAKAVNKSQQDIFESFAATKDTNMKEIDQKTEDLEIHLVIF